MREEIKREQASQSARNTQLLNLMDKMEQGEKSKKDFL